MKNVFILFFTIFSINAMADSKMAVDMNIDKLDFKKPAKGVGLAGNLIFKSTNITINGTVLSVNNVNNFFDSQIFVRPTFLGFSTQFGNYGFPLEADSAIGKVDSTVLINSKFILDDNQLNLSGETLNFLTHDTSIKLQNFRLYCQNIIEPAPLEKTIDATTDAPTNEMIKSCFNFLTLNGSTGSANPFAMLEYEGVDQKNGDKTFLSSTVSSFDFRKNQINANLVGSKIVSNDSYFINTSEVNLNCAKDEDLKEVDFEKIKKACLNRIKINPVKVGILDKKSNTHFNLDVKDFTVKDQVAYLTLNTGSLSDLHSTTYLNNLLLNCKKDIDTDLFDLNQVLKDCIAYTRLTLSEIKSSKPDDKKDSSIKNIIINSTNGNLLTHAEAKFLGLTAKVNIYGRIAFNQTRKQLSIVVTDARLPLGIRSVELFMYFLKKMLISKSIDIQNNIITISL